ncbi:hypothetical protein WN944_001919 [Citrus x changshan-huyou]|uniref:Uncharacterized protein n=1 Tax=Citrus x changshan-huyou TaxID=2935761 RepID=A0AAP0MKB7_9ROSI
MGGSKRFWVGEYDGGGGLSKKLVFWPEFGDKGGDFVVGLISGDHAVVLGVVDQEVERRQPLVDHHPR